MQKYEKKEYLRQARYMVAEIVSGMVRSGDARGARELIVWAAGENILIEEEARQLGRLVFLYDTRLGRLPGLKNKVRQIENRFRAQSTLGTVPYSPQVWA